MRKTATKENIAASLIFLLQSKPINRISVNEITNHCGISRMTFYYHFSDIDDLTRWTWEWHLSQFIKDRLYLDSWQEDCSSLLTSLRENRRTVINVYRYMDKEVLLQYTEKSIYTLLLPIVKDLSEDLTLSDEGKNDVTCFYSRALVGVVYEWCRSNMDEPEKQMVEDTAILLQGAIRQSLENAANARW